MNDGVFLQDLERVIGERFKTDPINETDIPREWRQFPLSWLCYGKRDVCVRETSPMWSDNDTMSDIIDLFDTYYRVIIDKIKQTLDMNIADIGRSVGIYIQPDYFDTCAVLIIQRNLNHLAYFREIKPWQLAFDTPATMESELNDEFETILNNIK